MSHTFSKRVVAAVSVGVGVLILVTALVGFRSSLGWLPIVGHWLAPHAADVVYVCPMHPEVRQNTPGTCPECGMDLELQSGDTMYVCPMHPEVRQDHPGTCPECGMDLEPEGAAGVHDHSGHDMSDGAGDPVPVPRAGLTLDLRRQQLIGVRIAEAEERQLGDTLRAVGIVRYDETRQADINMKVDGWIEELYVDFTGRSVTRGQPLFTFYSPDLLATQKEYLLALTTRDQLRDSAVADARDYAERMVRSARQRLHLWDLTEEQIDELERTREPRRALVFRSPAQGVVLEKRAVKGMRATAGESLYTLADLSVVWVEADVYERELSGISVGRAATVTLDAYPGERFAGRVSYIFPFVEQESRTVRVRLELPNRGSRLKPGMFANVELASPSRGPSLTVPSDAVVDSGRAQFVFLSLGDGYFEPRQVKAGRRANGVVEVLDGLEKGDRVASGATFFIDSESQLRAAMLGFADGPEGDASGGPGGAGPRYAVTFATEPDPPRSGDNTFVVTLRDPEGVPVTDAQVAVRLYMAPMPSMNMPAMYADATLLHVDGGTYRGRGKVSMAGRWDVTVNATRDGTRVASAQFGLVAR